MAAPLTHEGSIRVLSSYDGDCPFDSVTKMLNYLSGGIETALREQLRALAGIGELRTLQVEKLPGVDLAPGSPGPRRADRHLSAPAWRVKTHAGLAHERRTWLTRIGRTGFGR